MINMELTEKNQKFVETTFNENFALIRTILEMRDTHFKRGNYGPFICLMGSEVYCRTRQLYSPHGGISVRERILECEGIMEVTEDRGLQKSIIRLVTKG